MQKLPLGPAAISLFAGLCVSFQAFGYTPQWLECSGEQAISTGETTTKEPVSDVYVYDADTQHLFKYTESQKRLALLAAEPAPQQTLHWAGSSGGIPLSQWEGTLDRASMALRISYKSGPETRLWSESCKPTSPRPES